MYYIIGFVLLPVYLPNELPNFIIGSFHDADRVKYWQRPVHCTPGWN